MNPPAYSDWLPSDEALLTRFRAGDDAGFEMIAARYMGLIRASASRYTRMLRSYDDADCSQEGLLALLSACQHYDAEKGMSFKNYLMQCVRNRYVTILRSQSSGRTIPEQYMISFEDSDEDATDPTVVSVSEEVETKEYVAHLHKILEDRLSELEYKVALLHLSGYSYKECAERLNVSLKAIDNAQTRIRNKLSGSNTPRRDF